MSSAEDVSCARTEVQFPVISGQRAEDAVKLTSANRLLLTLKATRLS